MDILVALGAIVGFVVGMFVSAVLYGFTFLMLYNWFVMPTFGLPAIGLATAFGVRLAFLFATRQLDYVKDEYRKPLKHQIVSLLLYPLIVLLVGWIVYQFV